MSTSLSCPVCSSPAEALTPCRRCGFKLPGITYFADQTAYAAWQEQIHSVKDTFRAGNLRQLFGKPLLAMNHKCIAVLSPDSHELLILHRFGRPASLANVRQVSLSASHGAALMLDGTVQAWGDDMHQECNVSNIHGIASVLAGEGCTYLVTEDGQVTLRGASPFAGAIQSWTNIAKLSLGKHHLAGLRKDGSVCIAAEPGAPAAFRTGKADAATAVTVTEAPKSWKGITDIASADDYVLALTRTGRILSMGKLPAPVKWPSGIVQIAAARDFAMALTKDGQLLCAGTPLSHLSTDLSQETRNWSGLLCICASGSCAAALTLDQQLLYAGMSVNAGEKAAV